MKHLSARLAPLALSLAACLGAVGCVGGDVIDPVYEIDEDAYVVVMPFQDPSYGSRWDSPTGHELGLRTTRALADRAEFRVRPYEDVLELLMAERDVRRLDAREVSELCGADYVLVCELDEWRLRDTSNINMTYGRSRVRVKLFRVEDLAPDEAAREEEREQRRREARERAGLPAGGPERGGRIVHEDTVEAGYPNDFLSGGEGELFLSPEDVQAGLIERTALMVSRLYYAHEPESRVQ